MWQRRGVRRLLVKQAAWALLVLTFVLTACNTYNEPQRALPSSPEQYDASLSVTVSPSDTRSEVEKAYGGRVVVWEPEAGFAVLGLERGLRPLSADADPNRDVFRIPEATAAGQQWKDLIATWGGFTAQTGGQSAWSSGEPTTFSENMSFWQQLRLAEGQRDAPHLGAGVKVAVIDTGIDAGHPAFAGKLAPAREWGDFVDGDRNPQEAYGPSYGHGTGIAGIITQVAPNATILPLRALGGDGSGDLISVTIAVAWAVYYDADIINLSLGSDTNMRSLEAVIKYARDRGVLLVASVGNTGEAHVAYPARYDAEVIGVGSVDSSDIKSTFSAYGPELELLAPGESVYTPAPENRVATWTGTSSATAMVSGALALALGERHLSAGDLTRRLEESADTVDNLPGNWPYGRLGYGRLNLERLLQAVAW